MKNILLELWNDALLAPATCVLMLITMLVSIIGFYNKRFFQRGTLHPYSVYRGKQWHTVLTAGFVHRNGWHLLVNAFLIFYVPGFLEERMVEISGDAGHFQYIIFYLFTVTGGNAGSVLFNRNKFPVSSVGASTATFGAFGGIFAHKTMDTYALPFGVVAHGFYIWLAILIVLITAIFLRKKNTRFDNFSHFSGFIVGSAVVAIINTTT